MKRLLCIMLMIAMTACIQTGCKNGPQTQTPQSGDQSYSAADDITEFDYDNRLGGMLYADILETDEVWFFAGARSPNDKGSYLLYYVKENGEADIFCNDPACVHDDNCPARGIRNIYQFDGKLYYQKDFHPSGTNINAAVFRMDPDGGNRELYYQLKLDGSNMAESENGDFMMHRGQCFVTNYWNTITNGEPGFRLMLKKLDPESGTSTAIFDQSYGESMEHRVFFHGEHAYVLVCNSKPREDSEGPENYWKSTIELHRVNIETGESELIKKDEDSECILAECCFVDRNEDIYIVAQRAEGSGDDRHAVGARAYKYIDGKFTEIMRFEDEENGYYTIPICGDNVLGALCFKRDGDILKKVIVWLTDFEGNTLCKDTLPFAFLTEEQMQHIYITVGSFAGDGEMILRYTVYEKPVGNKPAEREHFIVYYDYSDGTIHETLLGRIRGGYQ